MPEAARKSLFFLVALPAVLRAAWRLWRLGRGHRLDQLAESLRRVEPFRFAALGNPAYLAGCVEALGRKRSCLERSLLLLDLWSRCGLEPRLHLGMARADDARHFHAWVTAGRPSPDPPARHREIWSG